MCSEKTQRNILEPDIVRILESERVTEIGALYKFLLQGLSWSLDQMRRRRNLKVQRSNAVFVIHKFV